MKKRMYNSPKMEATPLYLSACIMSGIGEGDSPNSKDAGQSTVDPLLGAPRKVF